MPNLPDGVVTGLRQGRFFASSRSRTAAQKGQNRETRNQAPAAKESICGLGRRSQSSAPFRGKSASHGPEIPGSYALGPEGSPLTPASPNTNDPTQLQNAVAARARDSGSLAGPRHPARGFAPIDPSTMPLGLVARNVSGFRNQNSLFSHLSRLSREATCSSRHSFLVRGREI